MRKTFMAIILMLLLLSACSKQTLEVSYTAENEKVQEVRESSYSENSNVEETTKEISLIPPAADDIDYYEKYKNGLKQAVEEDYSNSEYMRREPESAKEWKSTDGKISFILDTVYGPFGTASDIEAKYTINCVEYDTKVAFEPNKFKMYIGDFARSDYTTLLIGAYEYNHDEQTFTVTATTKNLTVYLDESIWITADEYYEKFGVSAAPVYNGGDKVTFKMIQ